MREGAMYQYQNDSGYSTAYTWDDGDTLTITVPTNEAYYQNLVWDYSSNYSDNYWSNKAAGMGSGLEYFLF